MDSSEGLDQVIQADEAAKVEYDGGGVVMMMMY